MPINLMNPIINPRTGLLRSGWRAAIFFALLLSPYMISGLLLKREETIEVVVIDASPEMILFYVLLVAWTGGISWFCLRFLERMRLSALGFALHSGWFGDVIKGFVIGASMMAAVVTLQFIGGAWVRFNPVWYGEGGIDWTGARVVATEIVAALVLLILAGAWEELVYRGYPFQTLLRGAPAIVPIL